MSEDEQDIEGPSKGVKVLLQIENVVNEGAIAFLATGAIIITLWSFFGAYEGGGFAEFGERIFPWITMLALMIIAREQWVSNLREYDGQHPIQ